MFDVTDKQELITWGIAIAVYALNEFRKWRLKRKKKKSTIDFDMDIHFQINSILYQMLMIYRACRVLIIQFHNGEEYYTGQSMIRMTVTNEVVFPGVKKISQDYNGIHVSSIMHSLMREIRALDYVYIPSKEEGESKIDTLGDVMTDLEMKSFMLIRIAQRKNDHTVAILALHFPHEKALNREYITTLMRSKHRLETIFDRL